MTLDEIIHNEASFAFAPACVAARGPFPIIIVIEGTASAITTSIAFETLESAQLFCDVFNQRLGLNRIAWTKIAQSSALAHTGTAPRLH